MEVHSFVSKRSVDNNDTVCTEPQALCAQWDRALERSIDNRVDEESSPPHHD
jgi:hypothetical protein